MKKTLIIAFLFISLFTINISFAEKKHSTVIATGYGTTYDSSLNNAFRDAIKQVVGIVLDSETILANNEIIKDEILTLSNGNIESYEVINKTEENGLFIVEIKAIVKNRNIQKKISEKISLSSNTRLDKNKIAEVITKRDTDLDQNVLFKKYLTSFFEENYEDLIYINNINLDIDEASYRNKKVDYKLSFTINFDIQKYKTAVAILKDNLNNMGITYQKRFFISNSAITGDYLDQEHFGQCHDSKIICLAIADYVAEKYVYDLYIIDNSDSFDSNGSLKKFLEDYIVSVFNGYKNTSPRKFSDYLNLFFEISANNEIIDLATTKKIFDGFKLKNERGEAVYNYLAAYYSAYVDVFLIAPNFITYPESLSSVKYNYEGSLNINEIENSDSISIKVELER